MEMETLLSFNSLIVKHLVAVVDIIYAIHMSHIALGQLCT